MQMSNTDWWKRVCQSFPLTKNAGIFDQSVALKTQMWVTGAFWAGTPLAGLGIFWKLLHQSRAQACHRGYLHIICLFVCLLLILAQHMMHITAEQFSNVSLKTSGPSGPKEYSGIDNRQQAHTTF